MVIIETLAWGKIEIVAEQVYKFPKGIPGFEDECEFALISGEEAPFSYLQSLNKSDLSFVVCDPFVFFPQYEFELSENEKEELEIEQNVWVRCLITINQPINQSTINLLGPIVFNPDRLLAKQVVLHRSSYKAKQALWISQQNDKAGE